MTVLRIGVDAWIIQDGNYDDFEVGADYCFALEFFPQELSPDAPDRSVASRHLAGATYDICGQVIYVSDEAWAIDFGLPAYQESKPPNWAELGQVVAGRIYVGVDPFSYSVRLKDAKGMPSLFRDWTVRKICLETTPWEETLTAGGGKLIQRSRVSPTFTAVAKTDAWRDDGGSAHYVLECETFW